MISHPSPTNQHGVDTQIQRTFLFHGIFRSESIQHKLEVRRRVGSLFVQIDGKAKQLDTTDGNLSFKEGKDVKLGGQTGYFKHFLAALIIEQHIINDNTVQ